MVHCYILFSLLMMRLLKSIETADAFPLMIPFDADYGTVVPCVLMSTDGHG